MAVAALLTASPAVGQSMEVTLLGTGDPTPRLDRFGPSTLLRAGDHLILVDAGRGVMQRLFQLGISSAELDAIFITHLHSDHVVGLVDLWLGGWVIDGRTAPLRIVGPPGTAAMMRHLRAAFSFDVDIRTSEARRSAEGIAVDVTEISDGFVWRSGDVTVKAFEVDHEPVEPAFGFRAEYAGRSVTWSGDTRPSENLIDNARGTDLLIHEIAEAPDHFKERNPNLPRLAHHTQAEGAAEVFARVAPRLAILSHLVLASGFPAENLVPLVQRTYGGHVVLGEDLMRIEVADEIRILPSLAQN